MEPITSGLISTLRTAIAGDLLRDVLSQLQPSLALTQVAQGTAMDASDLATHRWPSDASYASFVEDCVTGARRQLNECGHVTILADVREQDLFIRLTGEQVPPIAGSGLQNAVSGQDALRLLDAIDEDEVLASAGGERDHEDEDQRTIQIRSVVADSDTANVLLALPTRLFTFLAAIGDGASETTLDLVGPGSRLLLMEAGLVGLTARNTRLSERGRQIALAARDVALTMSDSQLDDAEYKDRMNGIRERASSDSALFSPQP